MQTINPAEHGYISGNGLLIHNQSAHTPDWKTYLQTTHNYIPPMDEHKTYAYSSNQRTEMFSVRSRLNLFSFYSVTGKYEVNMTSCLTEFVDTLSKIFLATIPHQKILNMVGYKLLVYLPDTIQAPFGFIRDELYTHDFLGGTLPKEQMRLYIRHFQYNDQLGVHALPCDKFDYSLMNFFYNLNISNSHSNSNLTNGGVNAGSLVNGTTPSFNIFSTNSTNGVGVNSTNGVGVNSTNNTNNTNGVNGTNGTSSMISSTGTFGTSTTANASTYNSGTFGAYTAPYTGFGATTNPFNIFSKK
jgi:hypothetical protein